MAKQKHIHARFLPTRPPVMATAVWPTLLHYWGAPAWSYGAIATLLAILWIAWARVCLNSEEIKDAPFDG